MTYFEMTNVTKKFEDKVALDDVSLVVSEPTIVGLVGKNGCGKTTLLRHVVGLQLPTSGHVRTLGVASQDLDAPQLSKMGMANQHSGLIGWMSANRLIRYVSSFYEVWDMELEQHLVELFEIDVKSRVLAMSPGNRQKLALVLAVCHHPSLLLLDEPLSDLDSIVRRDVIDALLDRFDRDHGAIVISSHLLNDLERFADRIVVMDRGRILEDASLDILKEKYGMNLEQMFRQIVGAAA